MAMNYVIMRKLCLIFIIIRARFKWKQIEPVSSRHARNAGIQVLNLSGNDLESVPPFVYSLPNLQELHLQNNCLMGKKRVNCIKSSIPKVFTIIEACINF